MARYRVILSKGTYKFLTETDRELSLRILEEISDLQNFPFLTKPHDLAKLKGRKNFYRLRVGNSRVIFKIDKATRTISVEKTGYRKSIYK